MEDYQSLLFPYAYNILGSSEDAKDAIQDVLLKYTDKGIKARNEKNYLIKSVVNQSINIKQRRRKFQSNEQWLPEPISTERTDLLVELRELVSYSVLFLLERLTPKERAVFILKEAFSYSHEQIADVMSISIDNSRKLLSRSHTNLGQSGKESKEPLNKELFTRIGTFTDAIRDRDLDSLHQLLSEDVSFHADGGEKVRVVKKQLSGVDEVADLLVMVHHKFQTNYSMKSTILNHQPALLYYYRDQLMSCQIFEFDDLQKINRINVILDPTKLKSLV